MKQGSYRHRSARPLLAWLEPITRQISGVPRRRA